MKAARVRKGFTLVELLTVMAIIAVLTAILIPAVSKVMANARRAEVGNNLHQIALAYAAYLNDSAQPRSLAGASIDDVALKLAAEAGLNDARLYIAGDDPLVQASAATPPDAVAFNDAGTWTLNPDFAAYPLSVVIASGIPPGAPPSSTPVAWTRGLLADGTWAPTTAANPGVFGNSGGFIAFLDGHVAWYRNLKGDDGEGVLRDYATHRPTYSINAALPPTAKALQSE